MTSWGTVVPTDLPQSRLRLDFGLRPAILALNEWAVPGLGGAFFVRQLTWSCLGLLLAEELSRPALAARIAESIEALASWLTIRQGSHEKEDRIQGKRKLRDLKALSFAAVSTGSAYVTVPFRRSATAALPGLGFCRSTQFRFNSLQLAPVGMALANAALVDDDVAKRLRKWITDPEMALKSSSNEFKRSLLPNAATSAECQLVHDQLLADASRSRLIALLAPYAIDLPELQTDKGSATFLQRIEDPTQRVRLDTCFAFERVRTTALQAAQQLAKAIKATAQPWADLARAPEVQREFAALQRDCGALAQRLAGLVERPTGVQEFCDEQHGDVPLEARIRTLAARLPQVFTSQPAALGRGIGYTDTLVAADAIDPLESDIVPAGGAIPRPLLRLKRLHDEALKGLAHAA
ncbi:hypothetical protein [uncultured Massilia sp.]|uniref:hypothetical protein n=1 Tax=uncultured Massilia sp. TaxID=169973 RepID=UPI0025D18ED3|nr:hypothetical protein [uncultured Massilia sp.]